MPRSLTPAGHRRLASRDPDARPPATARLPCSRPRRPLRTVSFEAPSRGLRTRCLRFTPAVARRRARLASTRWPVGSTGFTPAGLLREVSARTSPPLRQDFPGAPTSRVAPGRCRPGAPTDPDVRNSRIRLLGSRLRNAIGRSSGPPGLAAVDTAAGSARSAPMSATVCRRAGPANQPVHLAVWRFGICAANFGRGGDGGGAERPSRPW